MIKKTVKFFLQRVPRKHLQKVSHICCRAVSVFYAGNKLECPVCGKHYRKFLPYGYVNVREDALCPWCLSLERHRAIWLYLKNETTFFSDKLKVLHVAPEYCFIKRFEALENIDYITADLESPLAKVKLDVQSMPFEDNAFDVVICNHIMEHVDDDKKALSEIYRVIKPSGWGIILSPINKNRETTYEDPSITDPQQREKHFGQKDHVREYGLDYKNRLESCGFSVDIIDVYSKYNFEGKNTYSLINGEDIYIVNKRG